MDRLRAPVDESPERRRPRLAALRTLYVSYNMGLGLSLPYLAPFLLAQGVAATLVGPLFSLRTLASIVAQPFVGLGADRVGIGRTLRAATVLGCAGIGALLVARGPASFAAVFLLLALGQSAIPVLLDAATIAELENAHDRVEGPYAFARSRIFGSAAFAVSALAFGLFFRGAQSDATAPAAVKLMFGFGALSVLISAAVPPRPEGGDAARIAPPPATRDLARLLRLRGVPQILLATALQWIAMSSYNIFFGAHVEGHGGDAVTIGLSIGAAIAGEMVVMATASRWLRRVAPRHVLAFSAATGILRFSLTAVGSPAVIIAAQSLHAFSFAAFYLSMIDAMVRRTPPELRGSAQSLLTAGGSALGSLLGGLAAGPLFAVDHGRTLFLAAAGFSVLPTLAALAIPPLSPGAAATATRG